MTTLSTWIKGTDKKRSISLCSKINAYHTIVVTVNHQWLPGLKIHILLPPITYLQNNMVNTMKNHYFLMLTGKYASRVTKYCSDCLFIQKLADVFMFAVIPVILSLIY